ncbi:MAG TPA: NUDIX domain-containing protein [Casimicrobiaceae bacterium]|nr:NUDIX domain-containing protein [Casimicrobiaceae bacterium]
MGQSAGLLLYRRRGDAIEVLLVHPGGPFFARRDDGAWTIPKGEFDASEAAIDAARREFHEETGAVIDEEAHPLTPIRQAGGKRVVAFAVCANFDPSTLSSNRFTIEWPPRSGRRQSFPEVDRAEWFDLVRAETKINPAQCVWLDEVHQLAVRAVP